MNLTTYFFLLFSGCSDVEKDDHDHHHHEHEVMTTVILSFTSQTDGSLAEFTWVDLENGNPTIDDIVLKDSDEPCLHVMGSPTVVPWRHIS